MKGLFKHENLKNGKPFSGGDEINSELECDDAVRAWRERGCRDAVCSCPVTQDAASSSADHPLQLHSNSPADGMHTGPVPALQDSKAHAQDRSFVLQASLTTTEKF
jgi:hypothetical protein